MSRYQSDPDFGYEEQSACGKCLHYTWKTITCLFSHITLISMVVSYCVLGAVTFEALEVEHEKDVKRNISKLRKNVTEHLWKLTQDSPLLKVENFTDDAVIYLKEFEGALLKAMTKDGWDGEEDENKVQWTSTGALFYSIIVITTIGYGHIAPKTTWGKVVTIFYAILGIPLMLLCLSNIGDIMATSFRFLYWRVCCYVCTKKPKKNKRTKSIRMPDGRFARSRNASFRRSMRTSTKSADSGLEFSMSRSESDLRYIDEREHFKRGQSLPRMRPTRISEQNSRKISTVSQNYKPPGNQRAASLDRRKFQKNNDIEMDYMMLAKTPVLCNKYVVGKNELLSNNIPGITTRDMEGQGKMSPATRRAISMPRTQTNFLDIPDRYPSPLSSDKEEDDDASYRSSSRPRRARRSRSPMPYNPSPKMMTPLGYGHRSVYLDESSGDEYYAPGSKPRTKPVPIWLCVFLVISYIIAGAFLFDAWEGWGFLDSAYFCFITLTTIGFGDLVPAKGVSQDGYYATISIALCSLYLLFGISLLAMSFNLVQEEVISNVKSVAKTLGIIKNETDESDEDV